MIPIAKPFLGEEEAEAAKSAVLSGWVTQGPRVKEFEESFAAFTGARYATAVSNCTAALHLSLIAVGVKPGDVVVTVSHSYVATANAVRHTGAEPVFVDIDPDTFNISPGALSTFLSGECEERGGTLFYKNTGKLAKAPSPLASIKEPIGRVAAIMPVHQMGMPFDIKGVMEIARKYSLPVVEDAACAIGSEVDINGVAERVGRPHGDVACFSFHPRKVITTGDGGMITTNDLEIDKELKLLRQHAMSVPDTVRHGSGTVIFEEYLETGYNYRMTDIQAAVGVEQLKRLPEIIKERRRLAALYRELLTGVGWLKVTEEPVGVRTNWQSYPVCILDTGSHPQKDVMQTLLDKGIATRRGIMNSHQEPAYSPSIFTLPESETARDSVVLLPLYCGMSTEEVEEVVKEVKRL